MVRQRLHLRWLGLHNVDVSLKKGGSLLVVIGLFLFGPPATNYLLAKIHDKDKSKTGSKDSSNSSSNFSTNINNSDVYEDVFFLPDTLPPTVSGRI